MMDIANNQSSVCNNDICESDEDCGSCPEDCGCNDDDPCTDDVCTSGTCTYPDNGSCGEGGCTCPSGCDAVVNQSGPFVINGQDDTCYFFSGSLGNRINSWNADRVDLNGTDVTNQWQGDWQFPPQIDGGYYLYFESTDNHGHFEALYD